MGHDRPLVTDPCHILLLWKQTIPARGDCQEMSYAITQKSLSVPTWMDKSWRGSSFYSDQLQENYPSETWPSVL